jgi:hypothetical protein
MTQERRPADKNIPRQDGGRSDKPPSSRPGPKSGSGTSTGQTGRVSIDACPVPSRIGKVRDSQDSRDIFPVCPARRAQHMPASTHRRRVDCFDVGSDRVGDVRGASPLAR